MHDTLAAMKKTLGDQQEKTAYGESKLHRALISHGEKLNEFSERLSKAHKESHHSIEHHDKKPVEGHSVNLREKRGPPSLSRRLIPLPRPTNTEDLGSSRSRPKLIPSPRSAGHVQDLREISSERSFDPDNDVYL
jgi:hypothetical protein